MDAIAGLAFGIVVIDVIRRMGVDNDDIIAEDVLSSGLLAGALMALIYVLSILVGAQSRGIFELSENGGIALTQIAGHYLGGVGQFILAFTITFACLKTSIGLVTACSETFVKMTNGKISYRTWAILFTVFSFAVSNIGLSAIIEYSVPMLMLIYPPAIALILLAFIGKFFAHDRAVYVATMIGTWAAAIFDCMKTLPASVQTSLRLDVPIAFAEKYPAVVRQEPRLAAACTRRLCDRHGHPLEPEGRARPPCLTNQIKVKTHRTAELFLPCGVIFSAAPKTES